MPVTTILVLALIVAMFAVFMIVLGGVWIWCHLPEPSPRRVSATTSGAAAAAAR